MTTNARYLQPSLRRPLLAPCLRFAEALVVVALWTACQSDEEKAEAKDESSPSEPTFVGRWKYETEDVNMECEGTKLERDVQPRRPVEFIERDGTLTLVSETCRVPLTVEGSAARSDTSTECPWVDGMTVKMTSVRAELRSANEARVVTETDIVGKHPDAPDHAFNCSAISSGTLVKMGTAP